jgi:hypothetical protein
MSELRANAVATFEAVLQKAWEPQRLEEGWSWRITTSPDIVALLNVAHNSMLRAARDFGSQADPLVAWVRKADEFLLQQLSSAFIEQETDLSSLNYSYSWCRRLPSILAFLATNAVCRSALDLRNVINEGFFRVSRAASLLRAPASGAPVASRSLKQLVTMEDLACAVLLRHPNDDLPTAVTRLRSVWSGLLKRNHWANSQAVLHTKRTLVEAGLACETSGVVNIIQSSELSEQAAAKRRRLLEIPLDRRLFSGKCQLMSSASPFKS